MNQPKDGAARPSTDADPWSEFLSESPEPSPAAPVEADAAAPPPQAGDAYGYSGDAPYRSNESLFNQPPALEPEQFYGTDEVEPSHGSSKPYTTGLVASFPAPPESRHASSHALGAGTLAERAVAAALSHPAAHHPAPQPERALVPVTRPLPIKLDQGVSLGDVLAARVPMHWSEGVAVVQELCDILLQSGDAHPLIPDQDNVLLTAAGSVHVPPQAGGDRDIRSLGRLLHSLLTASSNPPLPLRLFVTSSISSPRYHSVELYADALSHYAAPGRQALVQALYHRSLKPAATLAPDAPSAVEAAGAGSRGRFSGALAVAAVAILMFASAAGTWWWMSSSAREAETLAAATSPASPVVLPAVEEPSATGNAATPAVVRRDPWARGRISVPRQRDDRYEEPAPRAAAPSPPPVTAAATLPPVIPTPQRPVLRAPVQISQPYTPPVASRPSPDAADAANVGTTGTVPQDPPTIYSQSDSDVVAPRMLTPALSFPSSVGGKPSSYVIELIVDERGTVEQARMPDRPSTLPDGALLSAAKMAKFTPARKNGVAVKYRLLMTVNRTAG